MSGTIFLIAILASAPAGASAGSGIPFTAPNCSLSSPPANAGEVLNEEKESTLKVYPRFKDFPRRYTGCQISWINMGSRWHQFAVAYFDKGKPAVLFAHGSMTGGASDLLCRYQDGKLATSSSEQCPDPSTVVVKSMPAGCVQLIQSGKKTPAECQDD